MKHVLWLDHGVLQGLVANQVPLIKKFLAFEIEFHLADNLSAAEQILIGQPKIDLLILDIVIAHNGYHNYGEEDSQRGVITGTFFILRNIKRLVGFNVPILVYATDAPSNLNQFKIIKNLRLNAYFLSKPSTSLDLVKKITEILKN